MAFPLVAQPVWASSILCRLPERRSQRTSKANNRQGGLRRAKVPGIDRHSLILPARSQKTTTLGCMGRAPPIQHAWLLPFLLSPPARAAPPARHLANDCAALPHRATDCQHLSPCTRASPPRPFSSIKRSSALTCVCPGAQSRALARRYLAYPATHGALPALPRPGDPILASCDYAPWGLPGPTPPAVPAHSAGAQMLSRHSTRPSRKLRTLSMAVAWTRHMGDSKWSVA
jgi:hypothetical protein